ncbi:SMP-30/gluconolactonase/LRE family protein [Novosphingobium sp. TH158]|uniref:SMP-30/gluconolactonase/LRE family protein n=1 Tax=Novosphingobium sp. TH158 TaxID=2067455 RepID=UPI000C7C7640|nr:SMP-30/gluconolactonase/LRE family protein [Novosphingobium sp. TH158]PLK26728.1 gluconolactonase [Novosphingobium sp. TH158]
MNAAGADVRDTKVIASGLYLEGLAVDYGRDLVWYSDCIAGGVHGVRPDGTPVFSLNPERMWTGGIMMNADGAVLSSGPGGIMWNRPEDGTRGWLIREVDGKPLIGVNEMTPDGSGGIYFGTVDVEQIEKGEQTRPALLYHLSASGEVRLATGPVGFANGLMRSLDGTRLFFNDTFDATYVFDILDDGLLGERRCLLKKEDCDGMAMDGDGNVLVTGYKSGSIVRMAPDGSILGMLDTPADAVTQLRFGGADLCDVYFNCVPLDAGDGLKEGEAPTEQRSFLMRGRVNRPGLAIAPAQFTL